MDITRRETTTTMINIGAESGFPLRMEKLDDGQPGKHWQCGKCGLRAAGSTHPLVGNCPRGGAHQWRRG